MADVTVKCQYLQDLRKRLGEMGYACQVVNNFFVIGSRSVDREPDVKTLQNLIARIKQQLEYAVLSEERARSSLSEWDAGVKMVTNVFAAVSTAIEKNTWVGKAKNFEKRREEKPHCFGTIMICVGQGGLPDDVQVVSISDLSRKKNRDESEIIRQCQQRGEWLFSPEVFLSVLDTVVEKLREGKLRLPISPKQLPTKLAIPRQINVEFRLPFKSVPQLPPGTGADAKGKA